MSMIADWSVKEKKPIIKNDKFYKSKKNIFFFEKIRFDDIVRVQWFFGILVSQENINLHKFSFGLKNVGVLFAIFFPFLSLVPVFAIMLIYWIIIDCYWIHFVILIRKVWFVLIITNYHHLTHIAWLIWIGENKNQYPTFLETDTKQTRKGWNKIGV